MLVILPTNVGGEQKFQVLRISDSTDLHEFMKEYATSVEAFAYVEGYWAKGLVSNADS